MMHKQIYVTILLCPTSLPLGHCLCSYSFIHFIPSCVSSTFSVFYDSQIQALDSISLLRLFLFCLINITHCLITVAIAASHCVRCTYLIYNFFMFIVHIFFSSFPFIYIIARLWWLVLVCHKKKRRICFFLQIHQDEPANNFQGFQSWECNKTNEN